MFNKLFVPLKIEKDPEENASHLLQTASGAEVLTTVP